MLPVGLEHTENAPFNYYLKNTGVLGESGENALKALVLASFFLPNFLCRLGRLGKERDGVGEYFIWL